MRMPRHMTAHGAEYAGGRLGRARFGRARREDEALRELLLRVNCNDRRAARRAAYAADLEQNEALQRARSLTAITLLGGVL